LKIVQKKKAQKKECRKFKIAEIWDFSFFKIRLAAKLVFKIQNTSKIERTQLFFTQFFQTCFWQISLKFFGFKNKKSVSAAFV
jgi:hypothetical protein